MKIEIVLCYILLLLTKLDYLLLNSKNDIFLRDKRRFVVHRVLK
jgi:uncharacterized membrane protein